jgi:hypothetical protein
VHAPGEEKSDDSKDGFYKKIEQFYKYFPKYHMKILLGDFNAKMGRENFLNPTIGNESIHQNSNDNSVRIVNFATSKNLVVKSTIFHTKTFVSTLRPLLMGRLTTKLITY